MADLLNVKTGGVKMMMKRAAAFIVAAVMSMGLAVSAGAKGGTAAVTELFDLTVNYMAEPLGTDTENISFGWKMKSSLIGQEQSAYKVDVLDGEETVWTSGRVENGDSAGIACGAKLEERTKYSWNVTAWDKNGREVTASSVFETGVNEDASWKSAEFICMPYSEAAPIFRREKKLNGKVSSARLYITAIGAYYAEVNGAQVYKTENGEKVYHHLNPGYGNSPYSISYETYDVTDMLKDKESAVVSIMGATGWSGPNGEGNLGAKGGQPAVKAMLSIEYEDGTAEDIVTDKKWKGTLDGPVTANGIYYGEDYSAVRAEELGDYSSAGYDDSAWYGGAVEAEETNVISAKTGGAMGRYLRISVSETGPATANDNENRLQIMELEVFDKDGENVALGAKASASDVFTYGSQWRIENINDGDNGKNSDSGYTSSVIARSQKSFRPGTPLTVTLDFGKTVDMDEIRFHGRTRIRSLEANVCPNYPKEFSAEVSDDGESWTKVLTDVRTESLKMGAEVLDTLTFGGKIVPAMGLSGRIVDEFEAVPTDIVLYSGTKKISEYVGGEIDEDARFSSFEKPITLLPGQTMLVNMGQNMTAVPEIRLSGKRGTAVTMKFGEILNDGSRVGNGAHDASGPKGSLYTHSLRGARSEAIYILSGNGEEVYQPKTSFFGYQYVQITTDDTVEISALRSRAVSSVYKKTGNIETNNKDVNRLFLNALYGQMSNYFTIPTDCPQRDERLSWTGDAQAFAKTAMYNFDSFAFLNRYQDIISENTLRDGYPAAVTGLSGYFHHWATGWSDVEIINAWAYYTRSGDKAFLEKNWDAMVFYMDYLERNERAADQAPNPDKWTYGDWLAFQGTGYELIADCYYGYVTSLMADMAAALGKTDEAQKYSEKFKAQKGAFLRTHVAYDGGDAEILAAPTLENNTFELSFEETTARYVRLNVSETGPGTSDDNEYRLQIMEFEVENGDGLNLALGKSASSNNDFNSPQYGWVAANLTDGDVDKGYSSNNNGTSILKTPIFVNIDLGQEEAINKVKLVLRKKAESMKAGVCPNFPKRFTIEVSNDNGNWTEVKNCLVKYEGEGSLTVKSGTNVTNKLFDRNKMGVFEDNSQTSLLWMLKLGWYKDEVMRKEAVKLLEENIRNDNPKPGSVRAKSGKNTLSVGFLGSNVITPVLSDEGKANVSYDLLLNTTMPSWLFEVKAGATTVWERWNSYDPEEGFGDKEMNSFNHFAYGSVAEWMYEYMAGISSDDGFESIVLQPTPDRGEQYNEEERIRIVNGEYDSVKGMIKSSWQADGGKITRYEALIPANSRAVLYLPIEKGAAEGFKNIYGAAYLGEEEHNGFVCAKFELLAGCYVFELDENTVTAAYKDGYSADGDAEAELRILSCEARDGKVFYEVRSTYDDADVYTALYEKNVLKEVKKNVLTGEFNAGEDGEYKFKVFAWKKNTEEPLSAAVEKTLKG